MKRNLALSALSLVAGAFLVLSFSPTKLYFFAFISAAVLLYCWLEATPRQAFWRGLLFGIGQFATGTSWLYISIHKFGNATGTIAGLITAAFILLMALYPATQGFIFSLLFRKKNLLIKCLVAFPTTWVIWEGLRSWLFSGFPWLLLGYSQTQTELNGYAPVLGIYGVSLVTAIIAGGVMVIFTKNSLKSKIVTSATLLAIVVISFPLHYHSWTKLADKPMSVALVQGNIPQTVKWDPSQAVDTINTYIKTTNQYWGKQIIIWPEAAIPVLANNVESLVEQLNKIAKKHHSALLFGAPISNENETKIFNAIIAIGDGNGIYFKRHLVPFGEYTPLEFLFKPIMNYFDIPNSDLSKGPAKQPLINAQHINIAPFICYEIAYPYLVANASKNAQLLVTINDDSWFGDSLAIPQQLQMAQMRSIETGRYMLYVSNTGITAIINPLGNITATAPENVLAVVTGDIHAATGNTPVMYYGIYPMLVILILLVLLSLSGRRKNGI